VASQFDKIGLKPAGTSGSSTVKFERRQVTPDGCKLTLIRGDQEIAVEWAQEATIAAPQRG